MQDLSRLGMEFGQHVQDTISQLLLGNIAPQSLSEMEQGVREAMLKLGNFLLANWLTLQNDRYPAQTIPCRCGDPAHYREMREGVFFPLLGRIVHRRAYYLCDTCHCGPYPLDERLGLRPGELSAALESLSGMTGAKLPFGQGSDLFARLTLLAVSPQSMDKATQAMGSEMQQVEASWIATSQDPAALLQQEQEDTPLERLYGSLDATKVHTDEQRDATGGWRDLKVGAWFETDARPPAHPDDQWDVQARNITYFCDIQEADSLPMKCCWPLVGAKLSIALQQSKYDRSAWLPSQAFWTANDAQGHPRRLTTGSYADAPSCNSYLPRWQPPSS
jgi:hypothetical protein